MDSDVLDILRRPADHLELRLHDHARGKPALMCAFLSEFDEAVDHRSGFASDDSGGLFGFSTDGTWREVARDRDAKARRLLLVTW